MVGEDETEVIEGRFWLPGDRYRGYGRLELDLVNGARIHLVDSNLTDFSGSGLDAPGPIDVLHGETLGGTPLTLFDVLPTNWRYEGFPPRGRDAIDAVIGRVVRGVWASSYDDLTASQVNSNHHGLKELLTGGQFDAGPLRPSSGSDDDPVPAPAVMKVELGDGHELQLVASWLRDISDGQVHPRLASHAQWHFATELPVETIERDYVGVLQDLILFATRQQSYVTSLKSFNEDYSSTEFWRRANPRPREQPKLYALALDLGNVDEPGTVVSAWFELYRRVGPVWGLFFAALDRRESLLEDRLLGLLSFCEGYHRALHDDPSLSKSEARKVVRAIKAALPDEHVRSVYAAALGHAHEQTQRDRLTFLTRRALNVVGEWWYVEEDVFLARLIDTRNWMVHWGKKGKRSVEKPEDMVELVRGLIVVLYVNIVLDLGLEASVAERVIGSGWRLEGPPEDVCEDRDAQED